jgi:hypothetical protein
MIGREEREGQGKHRRRKLTMHSFRSFVKLTYSDFLGYPDFLVNG